MKLFKEPGKQDKNPKSHEPKTTSTSSEKKIPLTSSEAYQILHDKNSDFNLANFLFYFNCLVNVQNSQFVDLTRGDEKELDNQKFIHDLNATVQRLVAALEDALPYPTLFGDVVRLQKQFQIVLRYYQEQCEQGQPVAQTFLHSLICKNAIREATLAQPGVLSPEHSEILIKYVINSTAESQMQEQIPQISKFITASFLADHRAEPGFSYSKPR